MINYFPRKFANNAIIVYFIALVAVSIFFINYAMGFLWMVLGVIEVVGFFTISSKTTREWSEFTSLNYAKHLFWIALALRLVWVVFSYFFYTEQTGQPFEYGAADSIGYHETAEWLCQLKWHEVMNYLFYGSSGYSDSGYPFYLTIIYKIFGPYIIVPRLIKAMLSAFTCVLVYRMASRMAGEKVGRMAGIFTMLMPNLIVYCGMHLKETEMLFLTTAFLERADYAMRTRKRATLNILVALLLGGSLFFFRTILGAAALFAFITAVLFAPDRVMKRGRKVVIGFWVVLALALLAGGVLYNEMESYWELRHTNQESKRFEQTSRGNLWAKYATGAVMAPMIFVLPFSTMVHIEGQETQLILSGGNFVRNFMGIFVIIALYVLLFKNKKWRDFALIGAFTIAYLGIIALSGFANSERFLLPGVLGLIVFWAYGVSTVDIKTIKFVKIWFFVVFLMEVAWGYFKIGSRGLLG